MNITPGISIGPYVIGMTRAEIRAQSRSPVTAFAKTPTSVQPTDDITDIGVHVHYDADDRCSVIEAWTRVSSRGSKLTIGSTEIEAKTMAELRGLLAQLSIRADAHEEGFEDASNGVGIYCHGFPSDGSLLDGVYVFRPRTTEA
jgi:hypothetical protein